MRCGCVALAFCAVTVGACSSNAEIASVRSLEPTFPELTVSKVEPVFVHEGKASFYSDSFSGRRTASGERFSQNKLTGASRKFPLGSRVVVTNADNGKSVEIVINDRGPYIKGRVIDLSRKAAQELGMIEDGVVDVRIEAKPSTQPNRHLRTRLTEMVAELSPPADTPSPILPIAFDAMGAGAQDRRVAAAE
ncbi:septal ring lytic transglycosylase RlpA family protein [Azospirillum sp. sgz302134]